LGRSLGGTGSLLIGRLVGLAHFFIAWAAGMGSLSDRVGEMGSRFGISNPQVALILSWRSSFDIVSIFWLLTVELNVSDMHNRVPVLFVALSLRLQPARGSYF
jgi:hypothetical protein